MFGNERDSIAVHYFDPEAASPEDWAKLHSFRRARHAEDLPGEPVLPDADFERELRLHRPLGESRRFIATRQGEFVGNLILMFRRDGSPGCEDFAAHVDAAGGVLRACRRQGIGRALARTLLAFMQAQGRTTATFKVHLPDGNAFMAALGAVGKYHSAENRLRLDALDWPSLARWREAVPLAADGLRWEVHAGRVPMARLGQLMAPFSALINEQPLDALDVPRMRYELPGYVTWYEDMDRRGGEHFLVLLCHGDDVAAMCDASWDARFPERVYQQLTAVARPWRGRGLAKAVKAAMLELVHTRHPGVRTMITHNAHANAPMLSINERLGFARHRDDRTYQLDRAVLASALAR